MRASRHIKQIEKLSLAAKLTANTSNKTVAEIGSRTNKGEAREKFCGFSNANKAPKCCI